MLSHYRLVEKIGEGGMGVVWKAEDTVLGRTVAIKVLPEALAADPDRLARLEREAQLLARLDHANVAAIYGLEEATPSGDEADVRFLVMQLVEGQTLAVLLAAGPLANDQLHHVATQLAAALAHAHGRGVVHRDLKSANVMIDTAGSVKVLDFGLAEHLPSLVESATTVTATLANAGTVAGTLPYMAPEVLRGHLAGALSDVYSLGVLLYEAAAGSLPFVADSGFELSSMILRDQPPPLPERVPPSTRDVILRCLAKKPEERFDSAAAVQDALASPSEASIRGAAASPSGDLCSIAVLPLANLSGDPDQEFFADGMTEALITDLAKIGALKVISRTSAMRYKGTDKALPQIARELGVEAIIEGSVLRAGDKIRVTAQLIHAATDTHLWAESYERRYANVLSLQSQVARAVAREVKAKLTPGEEAQLADRRSVDPLAHEACLKGRFFWNQRGDGLETSIGFFERAVAKDPGYAPAYSGLADAYALLGFYGYRAPHDSMPLAKQAAERALQIDDSLPEAHSSLGFVRTLYDWDFSGANRSFQRAFDLNPNYGPAIYWYTNLLVVWGRSLDAIPLLRRGLEYDPLNVYMQTHVGIIYMAARDYRRAEEELRRALEVDPAMINARANLGICLAQQSRIDEALAEMKVAVEASGKNSWALGLFGAIFALAGDREAALRIAGQLEQRRQSEYISALHIAAIHLYVGDGNKAIEWLEKAYEERAALVFSINSYAMLPFEALRPDPRFQGLLRGMGVSDEQLEIT
jgi:TolB-like protein/Tfp pilus assembly protein PilF